MANDRLAEIVKEGIAGNWNATTEPGECQIFARQSYEREYGKAYEKYRRRTANFTGRAFQAGGLAMTKVQAGALQKGDILYKCPSNLKYYGHVGIVVLATGAGLIGENSSTKIGRVRGALGYRTFAQFGHFDLVVRLPSQQAEKPEGVTEPVEPAKLILVVKDSAGELGYKHLEKSVLSDGRFSVNFDELSEALGTTGNIRKIIEAFGWNIYDEGDHLADKQSPAQYLFVQEATTD